MKLLTLLILIPYFSFSQIEAEQYMLAIPDTSKGLLQQPLFQNINYKWNKKKTWGLILISFAGLVDGVAEGYGHDNRKSFERKWGVKPLSYAGSQSWLLAYKDHDVNKGFKSEYRKRVGAPDLYHHLDDTRKWGYITAGVCLTIGGISKKDKDGKFKIQTWKAYAIDALIFSVASSVSKSAGMYWVRN